MDTYFGHTKSNNFSIDNFFYPYNNTLHTFDMGENQKMSSVITFFTPEYAVIGSDGRNFNSQTKQFTTDEKQKIVQQNNALVGMVGRNDYDFDGERKELEEILQDNNLYNILDTLHIQIEPYNNTQFTCVSPRQHLKTNFLTVSSIIIRNRTIEIETKSINNYLVTGVKHSLNYAVQLPFKEDKFVDNVRKCIEYDIEKEMENGREAVGGRIEIYEIFANGKINKVQ